MTNTAKTIATAEVNTEITIQIVLSIESGNYQIVTVHHNSDDAICWDGRSYAYEIQARRAANALFANIRSATKVAA